MRTLLHIHGEADQLEIAAPKTALAEEPLGNAMEGNELQGLLSCRQKTEW